MSRERAPAIHLWPTAALIVGATTLALLGLASLRSSLPADFHPFIGNVVSMALATTMIVIVLSVMPGFG